MFLCFNGLWLWPQHMCGHRLMCPSNWAALLCLGDLPGYLRFGYSCTTKFLGVDVYAHLPMTMWHVYMYIYIYTYIFKCMCIYISIWFFPKIGCPQIINSNRVFPEKKSIHFGVPLFLETPIYVSWIYIIGLRCIHPSTCKFHHLFDITTAAASSIQARIIRTWKDEP